MNLLKDKTTVLAAIGCLAVAGGGFLGLISPQQDQKAELTQTLQAQEQSNLSLDQQLPLLKARLAGITTQIDALRDLSARVPSQIDQADLYDQLGAIAATAGISEVTNLSISVPQMVQATPDEGPAPDDGDGGDAPAAPTTPAATPVLAYYDLSMSVRGSTEQVLAFLDGLRDAPRINVVSSSSIAADEDAVTLNINTRMFLQQVDVEGLAAQIEALAGTAQAEELPEPTPGEDLEEPTLPEDLSTTAPEDLPSIDPDTAVSNS
ncbi:hypothetical protein [Pseudactinotalea terrae]|uniref:hypothetical protein n=1 Tax=Pseudactinotalea terrae TaxID=1743262 RepID=UPI0012E1D0A7|nr:hypothetical protein [Pseudactinotalea terrae]